VTAVNRRHEGIRQKAQAGAQRRKGARLRDCGRQNAFSLTEVLAALMILALAASSVVVVIERSSVAAGSSMLRSRAFEVARHNMELLLASDSVEEKAEYGTSDLYPEIEYETVVESFYEPVNSRMWVRAVCSAGYLDADGQPQTVELTSWLTGLNKAQMMQIIEQRRAERERLEADQASGPADRIGPEAGLPEQRPERPDPLEGFDPNTMDITELFELLRNYAP
jgi:prepilin-type N-terminal cleavage/methylation domain-containing protein